MALDPRIILGLDTSSPLQGLSRGIQQGQQIAANSQKMQATQQQMAAMQEDRAYQASQRQELAQAKEYKRLAPLWSKDPQAWIEATQASGVLDDEDKQQALGMNDDMFKSLDAGVNRMLGITAKEGFTLGEGEKRFDAYGKAIAEGPAKTQKPTKRFEFKDGYVLDTFTGSQQKVSGITGEPDSLSTIFSDQSEEVITKASEAFKIVGGKAAGLAAAEKVVDRAAQLKKGNETADQMLELVNQLLDESTPLNEYGVKSTSNLEGLKQAAGPFQGHPMHPTFRGATLDAENRIQLLKDLATVPNLKLMTGVLSESDLKLIKSVSSGGLELRGSEDRLISTLRKMQTGLANRVANPFEPKKKEVGAFDLDKAVSRLDELKARIPR